jgi:hypothetical protein
MFLEECLVPSFVDTVFTRKIRILLWFNSHRSKCYWRFSSEGDCRRGDCWFGDRNFCELSGTFDGKIALVSVLEIITGETVTGWETGDVQGTVTGETVGLET